MFILKNIIKYVKGTNHWVGKNIFTHRICWTKCIERNPSWGAYSCSVNQLVSTFYGTQTFIIMPTAAYHWFLSWINEYSPLGNPKIFWHPAFWLKNFVHTLSLLNVLDTLSVSLSLTWSPFLVCSEVYKLWSSSLCSFLHHNVTSCHSGPSIFCNMFLYTPNVCSSLWVWD
jgi:hypothetical protein